MLKLASFLSVDVLNSEPLKEEKQEKHAPCTQINLKAAGQSFEKDLLELAFIGDIAAVDERVKTVLAEKRTLRIADAETGQTPLHMIARQGNAGEALGSKLLELSGVPSDVNYPDALGKTPLHVA